MAHLDEQTCTLTELPIPEGWLFAPTSFLTDRIVPTPERVWLPPAATGGGEVTFGIGEHRFAAPAPSGRLKRLTGRRPAEIRLQTKAPILDIRGGHPQNWAHFLNIHLALVALTCRETGRTPDHLHLLLPEDTPPYVKAAADLAKLEVTYTDNTVVGEGIALGFKDWNVIRGERCALLTDPAISPITQAIARGRTPTDVTPKKVFVSRRTTRALTNEDAVADHLAQRGFHKIYMEDFSPAEQIAIGHEATHVVGVHGAALAPFFYRDGSRPPLNLVELFPVGHLTNVYRAMVAGQSGRWSGVRGHIRPEHLKEIYRQDGKPYFAHSLDSFSVDLASIDLALGSG